MSHTVEMPPTAASSHVAGAAAHSANAPFIACWNDVLTPKWVRFRHLLSGAGQIHSDIAYATLPLRRGDRVLDVGCGFGETTLELADRVGPEGSVLGLDCGRAFLEIAAHEQRTAGVDNVRYCEADLETASLAPASFDLAVSRFGIMFCASPVRALRNLRAALRGGGVLGLVCWRSIADNPCWGAAEAVALRHLGAPTEPSASCGPGPFAMADAATNTRILQAAGFEDIRHRRIDRPVCVGRDVDEALAYQLMVGPAGFVMREAGAIGCASQPVVERELRGLLADHQRADGSVWMDSSTWFVTARAPDV